jgi:CheY-like chemotaxis protein
MISKIVLMEVAKHEFMSAAPPMRATWLRPVLLRRARQFIFLSFLFCASFIGRGDMYDSALDRRFAEPQGSTNGVSPPSDSVTDPHLAAILKALKAEQRARSEGPPPPPPESISLTTWLTLAVIVLAVILAFSRSIKILNERIKNRRVLSKEAEEALLRDKLIAEQPSLVAFFNELRFALGTEVEAAVSAETVGPQLSNKEKSNRLQQFFELAPPIIADLRAQLSKINRAPDRAVRLELLRAFFCRIDALKEKATMAELRPVWLMTCGLEGLVQQLSTTAANINPSVLRTAAGAVDLLETLCAPGVDSNLASRTHVELLAADDNPVCLSALSLALKKAFNEPDLAVDGTSGLAFAEKKNYDVIFLDVEMPGMDGFELCKRIRAGKLNQRTPVVFVTSHSDFNSRAKSTLVGGQDLIAKPYLSFEITVKALTLALRGRLQNDMNKTRPTSGGASSGGALERPSLAGHLPLLAVPLA